MRKHRMSAAFVRVESVTALAVDILQGWSVKVRTLTPPNTITSTEVILAATKPVITGSPELNPEYKGHARGWSLNFNALRQFCNEVKSAEAGSGPIKVPGTTS